MSMMLVDDVTFFTTTSTDNNNLVSRIVMILSSENELCTVCDRRTFISYWSADTGVDDYCTGMAGKKRSREKPSRQHDGLHRGGDFIGPGRETTNYLLQCVCVARERK